MNVLPPLPMDLALLNSEDIIPGVMGAASGYIESSVDFGKGI